MLIPVYFQPFRYPFHNNIGPSSPISPSKNLTITDTIFVTLNSLQYLKLINSNLRSLFSVS